MKRLWLCSLLALALSSAAATWGADDTPKKDEDGKTYQVPYRLTVPKHILIRAKLNGKGPFNFILDTGAPAMFLTPALAEKAGVKPDKNHWGTLDKLDIEGGVAADKVKVRVEEIFQLKGMNGLGLAGAEIHGIIGYDVLARYRMEIDFTQDKMVWTEMKWSPAAPKGMGGKGGGADPTLELMGMLMETLGKFLGAKPNPDTAPRGFLGLELTAAGDKVTVKAVLENSPAAKAGVQPGDRIAKMQDRTVEDLDDVQRFANKLTAKQDIKLTILRGKETKDITFKTGEGL
jgi:PDZ domain/Aspartyl protease